MKNLILLFVLSVLFASCEKEEIEPDESSEKTYNVTLYAYSEQGFSIINYMNADIEQFITSIYTTEHTVKTIQNEYSYRYSVSLSSQGADSLFLMATCSGKTTSMGFRSTGLGQNQISIDLKEMK